MQANTSHSPAATASFSRACTWRCGIGAGILRVSVILLTAWASGAWAADTPIQTEPAPASKTLELIRKRGIIHIGVKTDFAPFGQVGADGKPEGLEVDLARDMARRLGVRAELVRVTTESRFRQLEQGDIDVMIATTADTQARRQVATAIEPHYYSGGVTVLVRPGQRITDWAALRGQTLCANQGAYFNRPVSQRYLVELAIFRTPRDALLGLKEGRCVGYLYSTAAVQAYLKKPEWTGYTMPLPEIMLAPWALYISRKDGGSDLDRLLGDIVAQWHQSGFLLERESAWGIQPSRFLIDQRARWTQRSESGGVVCARNAAGQWPVECRNLEFVRADETAGLLAMGLWVRDTTGMNLTFFYDAFDRRVFLSGLLHTLLLMTGTVFFSLVVGISAAMLMETNVRWPRPFVQVLALYGQSTPPLLMMYLIFFGLGDLPAQRWGWNLSPVVVAIGCMSFYTGSAIMRVLLSASEHLREEKPDFRLNRFTVVRVTELNAGPLKSTLVNALKQSVIASAIAVPEILSACDAIMSDQGNLGVMMNIFLLTLLLLIALWSRLFDMVERHVKRHAGSRHA